MGRNSKLGGPSTRRATGVLTCKGMPRTGRFPFPGSPYHLPHVGVRQPWAICAGCWSSPLLLAIQSAPCAGWRQELIDQQFFSCSRCGACCRNIRQYEWYRHLDRGDGVCRHFDDDTNSCTIYEQRPDECRIDLLYERHFATRMSRAAYHAAVHAACLALQDAASTGTDTNFANSIPEKT